MQFRLRTLFILTAVICVFCGLITAPPFVAIPVFCGVSLLAPAFWVPGIIYGRDARRAFFIGGICSGTVPYLVLVFFSLMFFENGWRSFGYRSYNRGGLGEAQLLNLVSAIFIFSPAVMALFGGLLSTAVYRSLQPRGKPAPPASPFGPMATAPVIPAPPSPQP